VVTWYTLWWYVDVAATKVRGRYSDATTISSGNQCSTTRLQRGLDATVQESFTALLIYLLYSETSVFGLIYEYYRLAEKLKTCLLNMSLFWEIWKGFVIWILLPNLTIMYVICVTSAVESRIHKFDPKMWAQERCPITSSSVVCSTAGFWHFLSHDFSPCTSVFYCPFKTS